MIIGYGRVSTREQNLDRQTDELTAAGAARIYLDKISSRRDFQDRPQWTRMWEALRPGDVVMVVELDRMGRNLGDLLGILRDLEARGVQLRVLRGLFANVDTSTELGRLLFGIAGAFAQYEREVNRSRTLDGIAAARRRGVQGGRPFKLTPLEQQMVGQLYDEGKVPVKEIARQFGIGVDAVRSYAKRVRPVQQEQQGPAEL